MRPTAAVPLALAFALAACGGGSPAENQVEALEAAAEESTPEAAAVLENAADRIEENGAAPGAVQEAMQAAGKAQQPQRPQKAPPQQQAKPRAPGDPVPPPKIKASEESEHADHANMQH